ncbi:tetratricopeptide repeat protein [Streptacidiphilus sp. 4-A2]|nr:tetratricopeptide repeat protein [Streptacidiphilus sp. 4-A2]
MDDQAHNTPSPAGLRQDLLHRAVRLRQQGTEQDRIQLVALSEQHPQQAGIAYQTAWIHDTLGLEAEAAPFYCRALELPGLSPEDRHGAFLGLGSTYRLLGRYQESLTTLRLGLTEFPDDAALRTFLAMTLHNAGESGEAVRILLLVTAATSADPQVQQHRRAIAHYADHLDETP